MATGNGTAKGSGKGAGISKQAAPVGKLHKGSTKGTGKGTDVSKRAEAVGSHEQQAQSNAGHDSKKRQREVLGAGEELALLKGCSIHLSCAQPSLTMCDSI